ncbi:basic amino-acid permease [Trichomonascus vanleenenianus]|uniref:basic amino-acid permease n=1 Tax=Trichomonascus vanleenenianus TaxID=2268995 RepID=UPI003EC98EFD
MIAIAGVIGTGLFLGTGKSLANGGPASMLICYVIMGIIVYLTMLSLGEMATYMPVAGSFCTYAARFVDDSFGFALTWNYWFNDAVSTASDLTALQLVFEYWTDHFPTWVISLIFWLFLIAINIIHVKAYGELEYWLALLKVIAIVIFIILGIVVNCGVNPQHEYLGFRYWHIGDAPFVNGFGGFASVFVTASFALGGTESIAIAAGELKHAGTTLPSIIRMMFWRIIIFYVLSVFLIGICVPYNYPNLNNGDVTTSPFTLVFQFAGSQAAGSFMNAVIVTSVISAGNHALFAGTRLLYTLSLEGHAPAIFSRLTKARVPYVALLGTSFVAGLCFGSSFIGAGTLWSWLQALVGVSNQISWLCIGITSIRFRKGLKAQNKTHLLRYVNWTYPWGPWVVVISVTVIILIQGWTAFAPWNTSDFFNMYIELFIFPAMYIVWKLIKRTKVVKSEEMDLDTDRYVISEEEIEEEEEYKELSRWQKARKAILSCII